MKKLLVTLVIIMLSFTALTALAAPDGGLVAVKVENGVYLFLVIAINRNLACYRKAKAVGAEQHKIESNIIYKIVCSVCLEAQHSNQIGDNKKTDYLADCIKQGNREKILYYPFIFFYKSAYIHRCFSDSTPMLL